MRTRILGSAALAAVVVPLLSNQLAAETFVVDDNGGPGVDFTNLPEAIAAARTGDLLWVRPGVYSSFTATKGLRILAELGAVVTGNPSVQLLPAAELFHVSGLRIQTEVSLSSCAGSVLLENLSAGGSPWSLSVINCDDVRVRATSFYDPAGGNPLYVSQSSFVEFVDVAAKAEDYQFDWSGATALVVSAQSSVVAARSTFDGGDGGDCPELDCEAGSGGDGIFLDESRLVMSGNPGSPPIPFETYVSRGGDGGLSLSYGQEPAGDGLRIWDGFARLSGVTFVGGSPNGVPIRLNGGTLEQPAVADPDLVLLALSPTGPGATDAALPRATATLRVRGEAGSNVRIAIGTRPIVDPHPIIAIPRLVEIEQYIPAGQLGAGGTLDYAFKLPQGTRVGDVILAQADLVPPGGGTTRRTHSLHFMVR